MQAKIGLLTAKEGDAGLINCLFTATGGQNVDYTQIFRQLADAATGDDKGLLDLFDNAENIIKWLVI